MGNNDIIVLVVFAAVAAGLLAVLYLNLIR
jgi:Na+-translocating ferredoxin:NAD+ oxidoreductase RnfG subunit